MLVRRQPHQVPRRPRAHEPLDERMERLLDVERPRELRLRQPQLARQPIPLPRDRQPPVR
jgi:hypothetical protein